MKNYRYETSPEVCSSAIDLSLSDDGKIVEKICEGGIQGKWRCFQMTISLLS